VDQQLDWIQSRNRRRFGVSRVRPRRLTEPTIRRTILRVDDCVFVLAFCLIPPPASGRDWDQATPNCNCRRIPNCALVRRCSL
jgi:hypothetical protein